MNNTNMVREQLSALVDGHLRGDELTKTLEMVGIDAELRSTWQTYHLVGDVLRSGEHSRCSDTSRFMSRLQARLAVEPALPVVASRVPTPVLRLRPEAANEPIFRWKLLAGAASVAAAAAIGWNWISAPGAVDAGARLAQQQAPAAATSLASSPTGQSATTPLAASRVIVGNGSPEIMLRDPRLDQLLEAHQQAGGASQLPSGFLRNATFEGPSR